MIIIVTWLILGLTAMLPKMSGKDDFNYNQWQTGTFFNVNFSDKTQKNVKVETTTYPIEKFSPQNQKSAFLAFYCLTRGKRYRCEPINLFGVKKIYVKSIYLHDKWINAGTKCGWVFKQNGIKPTAGVSDVHVHPQDVIEWIYAQY